mmetsp:Transcript_16517/g.14419  ORF Transcript_16517/g.14419 Transcript_16517/m.14419 type:complete len:118 (+) Transcript_16517:580-933(+)
MKDLEKKYNVDINTTKLLNINRYCLLKGSKERSSSDNYTKIYPNSIHKEDTYNFSMTKENIEISESRRSSLFDTSIFNDSKYFHGKPEDDYNNQFPKKKSFNKTLYPQKLLSKSYNF